MTESHIKKTTFADVIGFLCKRPQMYTMRGSFNEVIAFIEGYTTGDRNRSTRLEWHGFSRWLSEKFEYPSSEVASEYVRKTYPDDREALESLARLYRQYAEESGKVQREGTET
jgi:hypothetical protein